MEVGEEIRFDDIINIRLYKVFNLFTVRSFQYIEISDIEWLK